MIALVTGAKGFIGARLCAALREAGNDVLEFDLDAGDISLQHALDAVGKADIVYHLAARAFVPDSWTKTHEYTQTNVMGTETVLEYCRAAHARLVFLSTYLYGEPQYLPVDETHPLCAVSPYHLTKLLCEELCAFYQKHFELDITIFRPFNVYGRGQNASFLLPKIMGQVLDPTCPLVSVYDLSPKRDYVYIHDLIDILVSVAAQNAQPDDPSVFNVGTGRSYSVLEAIETIFQVTGIVKPIEETAQKRVSEVSDCRADVTRLSGTLGIRPKYDLLAGVDAWYKELTGPHK